MALERLQVDSVPISIASSDSEAKGGGEVNPETFPELSSDRSDGHLGKEMKVAEEFESAENGVTE